MKVVDCNFYEIDFFDSFLQEPMIQNGTMTIHARDVIILSGLISQSKITIIDVKECQLVFEGVRRSEKQIYEYIGDPAEGNFRDPYRVFDTPVQELEGTVEHFELEGVLEKPLSWVSWDIEAQTFRLEVPDDTEIGSNQ